MNIKQLTHAICLAEERNFSRAAEKLHITQPALSRSIQSLEQDIELTLFDRHSTGVNPTHGGELFLAKAKELVRQANGLKREASMIRGAEVGSVALGVGHVALNLLLPKVLPQLTANHPQLDIRVDVQPAVTLLDRLLEEKIEFFIADDQQFSNHPQVETIPLTELSIGFFVRSGHPLSRQTRTTVEQLKQYNLASPSFVNKMDANNRSHISPILEWEWAGKISCDYIDVLIGVTLQSDAVLLTAKAIVAHQLKRGSLAMLNVDKPYEKMRSQLKLIKLRGRQLSPAANLILTLLRTQCEN